jgi:hypothetical protein
VRGVVVFCGEGVLYRPNESFSAAEPIQEGMALCKTFAAQFTCHAICDTDKKQFAEMWLRLNGLKEIVPHTHELKDGLDTEEFEWQTICSIRASGPIYFVVSFRDEIIERCYNAGIYSLQFTRPGSYGATIVRKPWHEASALVRAKALSERAEDEPELL